MPLFPFGNCCCDECDLARARLRGPKYRTRRLIALGLLLAAIAYATLGCLSTPSKPPTLPTDHTALFTATCKAIWLAELKREIDPDGLAGCLSLARSGKTAEQITAVVRASAEYIALHTQPPVPPVVDTPTMRGRLSFDRRPREDFAKARYPDGTEFQWRGVTAFGLLEQVAHGKEAAAVAWMKARRGQGFTILRVLAMNHGWLNLPPADGRAALPKFLRLAADADLYVQIVALAGTKDRPRAFLDEQVRAVGLSCAAASNCVLELANEPYHGSQHDALALPSTMASLHRKVPADVPVAYGAPRTDEPLVATTQFIEGKRDDGTLFCDGADFVVLHRKRNADIWDDLRRFTELQKVAKACGKFTVDSEPFGFAEARKVGTNTRRIEDYAAFGQGMLTRAFGLGSNYHCDACLLSTPLGPKQTVAAEQFIAGSKFIRDGVTFRFVNAKAPDSAVKDASFIGPNCSTCNVMRGFSFFSPGYNLFAWIGLRGDPKPVWQNGWKARSVVAERPGFQVLEIGK